MTIALSWVEVFFFPAIAAAWWVGTRSGMRIAMNDEKRTLYWRNRAKAAEGQLRSIKRTTDQQSVGG